MSINLSVVDTGLGTDYKGATAQHLDKATVPEHETDMSDENKVDGEEPKNPLREIVQPIIDLIHAPRALWGVNLSYMIEGMVYFGILGYLHMFFVQYVGLTDEWASPMLGFLTFGITLSMVFLGGVSDKIGLRAALLLSLGIMLIGRVIMSLGPAMGLPPGGLWSTIHLMTMGGILFVVLGYGMYQPAAYSAVRQFTSPKTAAMGFAMLYGVMNLGGWFPTFFAPVRRAIGISGAFWVYVGFNLLALLVTFTILSRRTVRKAMEEAKAARKAEGAEENVAEAREEPGPKEPFSVMNWLKNHPLADGKFTFFIFALIPVQTLFAYNWLVLPPYVERAYRGTWIGTNFEAAVNFNPLLIFVLLPIVTALTHKKKMYNMMILGTFIMAAPTFLLALGANIWTLSGYIIIMTVGEAMWQPRFLQYAAEIAPPGRTGAYMGVAQFPWFLTKVVCSLYAGHALATWCPDKGAQDTQTMWLYFGCIAISSTVMLILAKRWLGKDFKTKA